MVMCKQTVIRIKGTVGDLIKRLESDTIDKSFIGILTLKLVTPIKDAKRGGFSSFEEFNKYIGRNSDKDGDSFSEGREDCCRN